MKRIALLLLLAVVVLITDLSLAALAAEYHLPFARSDNVLKEYDAEDIEKLNQILNLIYAGNLENAETIIPLIKDNELRWTGIYYIAVEGYASRGNIEKAVSLIDEMIIDNYREVEVSVSDQEIQGQEQVYLRNIIIAAVRGDYWEKTLKVFPNLLPPYDDTAVETTVLFLKERKVFERFLGHLDYRISNRNRSLLTYENKKGSYLRISYREDTKQIEDIYHYK